MTIKQMFCGLLFFLSSVSLRGMHTLKVGSSITCAATGLGLIAYAIKNNNRFKDGTGFKDNQDEFKTFYIGEWLTEVLVPLSGGTALMFTGFFLAHVS